MTACQRRFRKGQLLPGSSRYICDGPCVAFGKRVHKVSLGTLGKRCPRIACGFGGFIPHKCGRLPRATGDSILGNCFLAARGTSDMVRVLPSENSCPCNVTVAIATPARCGHSGRLHASDSPVLCVGGGLAGLTAVATRAHEWFWTRVCR